MNKTNEARNEVFRFFTGAALVAALKGVNDGICGMHEYTAQFSTQEEKDAYRQGHWSAARRVVEWSEENGYQA